MKSVSSLPFFQRFGAEFVFADVFLFRVVFYGLHLESVPATSSAIYYINSEMDRSLINRDRAESLFYFEYNCVRSTPASTRDGGKELTCAC